MPASFGKPVVLAVLDGVGIDWVNNGNAVMRAATPFLERAWDGYPHGRLYASGEDVGLPAGTKGNSEVGHTNIGAGSVVYQYLLRINKTISEGTFFKNEAMLKAINNAKNLGKKLHLMGLVSDGNVHASLDHFEAIIDMCRQSGLSRDQVFVHAFTDGRDSSPKSSEQYLQRVENKCKGSGIGSIASISGRQIAMDRNLVWKRVKRTYDLLVGGQPENTFSTWQEVVSYYYQNGVTDEFFPPSLISTSGFSRFEDGDSVIFYNFRPDRAVELTQSIVLKDFQEFERSRTVNVTFVGMTWYKKDLPIDVAFMPADVALPLGRVLAERGLRQLRIAESEKFPHVTYFLNGGRNLIFEGEDRIRIPSPRVATYDLKPEMSARLLTKILKERLGLKIYDFIAVNYANGDMVGHTGNLNASISAMETVDRCMEDLADTVVKKLGGTLVITADHGNAEELINKESGGVDTEHSSNPVPFICMTRNARSMELPMGRLADVSPSILKMLGVSPPSSMTGKPLCPSA